MIKSKRKWRRGGKNRFDQVSSRAGGCFEWTLARGCADVTRLHPAVALARIVTFKMLEDKALI